MLGGVKNWDQEVVPHYRLTGSPRYSFFIKLVDKCDYDLAN